MYYAYLTEPERQFDLVRQHIKGLRRIPEFEYSMVTIFVER